MPQTSPHPRGLKLGVRLLPFLAPCLSPTSTRSRSVHTADLSVQTCLATADLAPGMDGSSMRSGPSRSSVCRKHSTEIPYRCRSANFEKIGAPALRIDGEGSAIDAQRTEVGRWDPRRDLSEETERDGERERGGGQGGGWKMSQLGRLMESPKIFLMLGEDHHFVFRLRSGLILTVRQTDARFN
ncbi:hypothetical protein MPTK1_1g16380 [Marchantia polymorpha subsp. ruderalis]|uniref:Uncharacterized protein n=2 Tax=Marchantia polymorpha TaxID=3197 RepID=A0AAF6AQT2_MARPO|nr:hypothetical protein MARPO_0033s0022 [Marchantia polymorpha]BBM98802.1 hypothetical protein Mp_1g16380 [Marchantia polymorpha subsp. ruderalis]|eukprot:PTQ41601.1 hypothetical protein MARPO_0033s0022 [Marchantia polymorpha]